MTAAAGRARFKRICAHRKCFKLNNNNNFFFKIHFMVNFCHKELLSCNTAGWCVEILYFNRIRIQMQKNFFYLK